jgi:glycosyltransferase involved in cell wall biosynthesis
MQRDLLASVVISTYNRAEVLPLTLAALGKQTLDPAIYEVVVVNDGSTDRTAEVLAGLSLPCRLRYVALSRNQGVSHGRNQGIREARGRNLILLSDDLIVPENFLQTHLDTLRQFPGWWVVGGFKQLPTLCETSLGRYLDRIEQNIEQGLKTAVLGPNLWELSTPTARNLCLPAEHLDRIGLFDERFPFGCEDQDLAHRAQEELGVRFVYNTNITCLHNDGNTTLRRLCRGQQIGAYSCVFFCDKYPHIHGNAPHVKINGYIRSGDGVRLTCRKLAKRALAFAPVTALLEGTIGLAERLRCPDKVLHRLYSVAVAVYLFRGWRDGLAELARQKGPAPVPSACNQMAGAGQ